MSFSVQEIDSAIRFTCLKERLEVAPQNTLANIKIITYIYYKIYIMGITNTKNNDIFPP